MQCSTKKNEISFIIKELENKIFDASCLSNQALQTLKRIKVLVEKTDQSGVKTLIAKVASVLTNLGTQRIGRSQIMINELKSLDEEMYYRTLSSWIAKKKIPLNQLAMTSEELLRLAPWLTHLELTGPCIDENFLGELLQSTKKLQSLVIREYHDFRGLAFRNYQQSNLLHKLKIINCQTFDQTLPDNLQNLQTLCIGHCPTYCQKLPNQLNNLEELIIQHCFTFDTELPKSLPSLKRLELWGLSAFNQKLPQAMPELRELKIWHCNRFNSSLPKELPNVVQVEICECPAFNQEVIEMPRLQRLNIVSCDEFDRIVHFQKNLKKLSLGCKKFNQKLPEIFPCLQKLRIVNSLFNQELPKEMPSLRELTILGCPDFNKNLPVIAPNLKSVSLRDVCRFNPLVMSLNTLLLLHRFAPQMLVSCSARLREVQANRIKERLFVLEKGPIATENLSSLKPLLRLLKIPLEEFLKKHLQYRIPFELREIEDKVKRGVDEKEIEANLLMLEKSPNFSLYLREIIHSFPILTSYLVRKKKGEYAEKFSFFSQRENLLVFLPLQKPDVINQVIQEVPESKKREWLRAKLQLEGYSGSARGGLRACKEKKQNLLQKRKLVNSIPLNVLAALASMDAKALLELLFAMDDRALSVVIPLMPERQFLDHLKKQKLFFHKELLNFATSKQKSSYIKEDLFEISLDQDWENTGKNIDHEIQFVKEKQGSASDDQVKQNYTPTKPLLETFWVRALHPINTKLQQNERLLSSLKKALLKYTPPSKRFREEVSAYIQGKLGILDNIKMEIRQRKAKVFKASHDPESVENLPAKFYDPITEEIMLNPYMDEEGRVTLNMSTWERCRGLNPYTMLPVKIKPNTTLKREIDGFEAPSKIRFQ